MNSHVLHSAVRWSRRACAVGALALAIFLSPGAGTAEPPVERGAPPSNLSVTTEFLNVDDLGNTCTMSNDGQGVYQDGVNGVSSILTANTCNGMTWGDWRFNVVNSTRSVTQSFFAADAVQPGDPHAQNPFVAANPPYWGSQLQHTNTNVQCTCTAHNDMYTMTAGQTFNCPMINSWTDSTGVGFGDGPGLSFTGFPETTDVQVTCNAVSGGHCVDWFIEPIGAPTTEAVGRLNQSPTCKHCSKIDDGDFYMRFKIHVTLP